MQCSAGIVRCPATWPSPSPSFGPPGPACSLPVGKTGSESGSGSGGLEWSIFQNVQHLFCDSGNVSDEGGNGGDESGDGGDDHHFYYHHHDNLHKKRITWRCQHKAEFNKKILFGLKARLPARYSEIYLDTFPK